MGFFKDNQLSSSNIYCFEIFRSVSHFKTDCLAFSQRFKSVRLIFRIMNTHIRSVFARNESVTFGFEEAS